MNDKQKNIALAKSDFLANYSKSYESAALKLPAKQMFIDAYNLGKLLPDIFKVLGSVSFKTAERWKKQLTDTGGDVDALAPNYKYKNISQRKLSEIEMKVFVDLLLDPRALDIGKCIAHTKYRLSMHGIPVSSSDMTYRRYAADFYEQNRLVWTRMREGDKALKDKFLPYVERDAARLEVGDVFVADGKTTTFNIINPYTGKAQKSTLIGHLDWKSKDIAGWELMLTENVQAIASSLRNAILRLQRIPKIAYQDNGKAFKARFFQNSPSFEESGFYGLFGRLNIEPVFSLPYNARAKVIERVWREFVEGGEKLIPSYTGTSPVDKPAYMMRNEKFHVKLHEQRYGTDGIAIKIDEAKEYIENFLRFYRLQECPHVAGKTIGEVFNESRAIENPVKENLLDDMMMQLQEGDSQVYRNGVRLLDAHYYAPELTNIVGDYVRVKVSIFDYSYVKIFNCDGRFICRAERQEKTHPMAKQLGTVKDQQDFKEKMKLQQRAKKSANEQTAQIMRWHQGASRMIADGTYGATAIVELPVSNEPAALPAPVGSTTAIDNSENIKTYLDD